MIAIIAAAVLAVLLTAALTADTPEAAAPPDEHDQPVVLVPEPLEKPDPSIQDVVLAYEKLSAEKDRLYARGHEVLIRDDGLREHADPNLVSDMRDLIGKELFIDGDPGEDQLPADAIVVEASGEGLTDTAFLSAAIEVLETGGYAAPQDLTALKDCLATQQRLTSLIVAVSCPAAGQEKGPRTGPKGPEEVPEETRADNEPTAIIEETDEEPAPLNEVPVFCETVCGTFCADRSDVTAVVCQFVTTEGGAFAF